jgi:hypothetical protein
MHTLQTYVKLWYFTTPTRLFHPQGVHTPNFRLAVISLITSVIFIIRSIQQLNLKYMVVDLRKPIKSIIRHESVNVHITLMFAV